MSIEALEGRIVPTTYGVEVGPDTGQGFGNSGDLRYCINQANANGGGILNFGESGTIYLNGPLPTITSNITITGGGQNYATLIGSNYTLNGNGGILTIAKGATVEIDDTAFIDGTVTGTGTNGNGGGIYNSGNLTLIDDSVVGNTASQNGGGIYNASTGTITIDDQSDGTSSSIGQNQAATGGGIANYGTIYIYYNVTIYANTATGTLGGGGIYNASQLSLSGDSLGPITITGNSATNGSGGGLLLDAGSTTTIDNYVTIGPYGQGGYGHNTAADYGNGIAYYSGATLDFTIPYSGDLDDPNGDPVQVN